MMNKFENKILLSPSHMSGDEMQFIQKAFQENWVVPLGPNVDRFENDMINFLEEDDIFAVAMNSGTSAIHVALRLLNVQQNEEVFCSSATFIATANPILYEKAVPVFIDSEIETWNMCPKSLLKAIEFKKKNNKLPTKLIITDLFGMSANYLEIEDICKTFNIDIIEDAAESLGSKYRDKRCGTFGKFGVFSFNGNKIITTSGGGMLITHSRADAEKALFLVTQARDKAPYYLHSDIGYNYRLSNICAGIGIGQLLNIEARVLARRRNFDIYSSDLKETPMTFQHDKEFHYSNHWLTTALIDQSSGKSPTDLIKYLQERNVECRHTWKPLHTQPIFESNEFFSIYNEPVSEKIFNEGICLPSGSSMDEKTVRTICEMIKHFF